MRITIDRTRAMPVRQQLRAAIEHDIAFGTLAPGAALPSVRALARGAGVAPMTVAAVYAGLKAAGLVASRAGAGTYVAAGARPAADALRLGIDAVYDAAVEAGMAPHDAAALIAARAGWRAGEGARPAIVMVGLFAEATARYACCVSGQVARRVEPITLAALQGDAAVRARVTSAALVLSFANIGEDLAALLPGVPVLLLRFIPAEATRLALASIDPLARVVAVSRFADFLPILALGLRRFAAHVGDVTTLCLDDPALAGARARADVLVLSTGAETAAAGGGAEVIEYRHIPDPGDVERLVAPRLGARPQMPERKEA